MTTKNFVVKNGLTTGNITLDALTDIITTTGNVSAANLLTGGQVSATGNITGNNLTIGNIVSAGGNVTGANILTVGNVSASGAVLGSNVYVSSLGNEQIAIAFTNGQLVGGTDLRWEFSNAALWTTNLKSNGYISTSGNVTGANIYTGGVVSSTGNGTFANINTGIVSASGNITAANANLGNAVTANFLIGNGYQITGLTLGNSLTDVNTPTPTAGQYLVYNGTQWTAISAGSTSAGQGVGFWLSTPIINAINANNDIQVDTLGSSPNTSAQTYANVTVNGTAAIAGFVSAPLNRTIWEAGNWDFSLWANISAIGGTNTINAGIHQILPNAGTVTTTGTGTTRTATASSGTPFANVVPGSDVILSSYLQTPQGLYRITAKTSDTVVSINVPTTYTNETTVSASVWVPLFNIGSAAFTTTALFEYNFNTTQPAWYVTTNSAMGLLLAATTSTSKSVYVTINGTNQASHFTTPLATLHDELAGLQGGTANQYYHLTNAEYTGTGTGNFVRATSPVLTTPNIGAAIGTSLSVTGNVTANNANLGNLATANYFTGTLTTNAQPNITSVGTLTSLSVSGNANTGNVNTGNINASVVSASGNGTFANVDTGIVSASGNITGANILTGGLISAGGNLTSANVNTGIVSASGNITGANLITSGLLTVTGNITSGNANLGNAVIANYFIGSGNNLSNIQGANVTGTVANATHASTANTVVDGTQSNITSVGTLTSLSVSGTANIGNNLNVSGNAEITGNLIVNGNITYVNVETLAVEDPIIALGGGVNGAPLTNDDGKDRGSLLHYYTSTPVDAFMGWDNSNGEFALGSNVTVTNDVVAFNTFGNLRLNNLLGSAANFSGNITAANANLGNAVIANYFIGSGNNLSNIQGANVSGTVANATHASTANTVTDGAQSNITSVGTLTSVSVSGNANIGNIGTGIITASGNITSANLLTGYISASANIDSANLNTGIVSANGNVTGANLTTGGLVSATGNVDANNINAGNIISAGGNITGANLLTGGLISSTGNLTSANVNTGIVSASGNVDAANVNTSILSASSNITGANILTGGLISATGNLTSNNVNTGIVSASSNVTGGNLLTGGLISATGNLNSGNVNTGIMSATSNITGANLLTGGLISATGNIETANYVLGNGFYLTGVSTTSNTIFNGNSNIFVNANSNIDFTIAGNADVVVFTGTGAVISGTANITGNANIGNVGTGILTASGNITGSNLNTAGVVSAGGNVTGANVLTGGLISATGNLTSGNVNTGIVSASGNLLVLPLILLVII